MILVGTVFAVVTGLMLPIKLILFGYVIDEFVYYTTAISNNNDGIDNVSFTSLANQYAATMNSNCSVSLILQGPLSNDTGQSFMLLCHNETEHKLSNVVEYACDPRSQLLSTINSFSINCVWIGIFVLLVVFLANIFFSISAYRQTRMIRHAFYNSVLHQEVGWFDMIDGNILSAQLAE